MAVMLLIATFFVGYGVRGWRIDEEAREQESLVGQMKNYTYEQKNDSNLREQLDEEAEGKNELQRHIFKLNAEIQQRKAKIYEAQRQADNKANEGQLDEEAKGKNELQRHISKLNAEIQQWKAEYKSDRLAKIAQIL